MTTRTVLWVSGLAFLTAFHPSAAGAKAPHKGVPQPSAQMTAAMRDFAPDCAPFLTIASDAARSVFERAEASRSLTSCLEIRRATESVEAIRKSVPAAEALALQMRADAVIREAEVLREANEGGESFLNMRWGLGFGFSFGFDDHVESAAVVDGVVRVTEDRTDQPRVVFEFHRYFWCSDREKDAYRGCGPFFAVAASQDEVLSGVGVGFMFGARPRGSSSPEGFSVGAGVILDAKIKTLADGFEADEPLPSGETGVRYEEKARWSWLVFVTRSF